MKGHFDFLATVARDKDAGGGGGLADAAAAAAAASPAAAGADPAAAAGAPPAAYYPDGLPDTYRGKTDKETVDKLWGDINGRPKAPEKADGYALELPKAMQERFGDLSKDPVLPLWREVAHELGLDNGKFNTAFVKLYEKMDAAGVLEKPLDIEAEFAKLEPNAGDPKQRRAGAIERVNAATSFARGLETRGVLSKDAAVRLAMQANDATGVMLIEGLMKGMKEHGPQGGGSGAGQSTDLNDPAVAARLMYPNSQRK